MSARKKEKQKPEDIKDIINKVIGKIEKENPGNKEKILAAWKKAAGEKINVHSRPVTIRRDILTVEVDSSTWFYTVNLQKRNILNSLNRELKDIKVKNIKLRMGEIT